MGGGFFFGVRLCFDEAGDGLSISGDGRVAAGDAFLGDVRRGRDLGLHRMQISFSLVPLLVLSSVAQRVWTGFLHLLHLWRSVERVGYRHRVPTQQRGMTIEIVSRGASYGKEATHNKIMERSSAGFGGEANFIT